MWRGRFWVWTWRLWVTAIKYCSGKRVPSSRCRCNVLSGTLSFSSLFSTWKLSGYVSQFCVHLHDSHGPGVHGFKPTHSLGFAVYRVHPTFSGAFPVRSVSQSMHFCIGYSAVSKWNHRFVVRRGVSIRRSMVEWSTWYWSRISATNWFPSVLWHCWLGHLACENRPRNQCWLGYLVSK